MNKSFYFLAFLIFPITIFAQNVEELLTSDTWNISYTINPQRERTDEQDENLIRSNWVKFNADGTFETPGGMGGKNKGNWAYDSSTNMITFRERAGSYKAQVEEISDMNLLLNYVNDGGHKIGLIHFVYVPKAKSGEEITGILTSGRWLVTLKRYDNDISEKTPDEQKAGTWYRFNADNTYQKSEFFGDETPVVSEGSWFLDDKFQLNLDAGENTIYSVIGDNSKLILTTVSGGYNTIEFRKSSDE